LRTAYGKSPFFEYYADDFAPFYERRYDFLIDFNEGLRRLVAELLDVDTPVSLATTFEPLSPLPQPDVRPYYQVFAQRRGFQADLSI
ncbi:WbqC family protein, partial [Klebsiella pneumoniae]|nr:WbqC family protein [Klebsiella pneumoniae]